MRKMISDIIIAFFIWTMLYFMFKPGQDIMKRAALENFYVLEFLIISGFIATIIVDAYIRLHPKK